MLLINILPIALLSLVQFVTSSPSERNIQSRAVLTTSSDRIKCNSSIPLDNSNCTTGYACVEDPDIIHTLRPREYPSRTIYGFCTKLHPEWSCGGFAGPQGNPCPFPDQQVCVASVQPDCADCAGSCAFNNGTDAQTIPVNGTTTEPEPDPEPSTVDPCPVRGPIRETGVKRKRFSVCPLVAEGP